MIKFINIMKRFFTLILILGTVFGSYSQTECETNYTVYRHEYKQKNYDEALKSWRKVFLECPTYNQYIFSNGPKIIISQIKKNNQYRDNYIDTLMMVYDMRIEYFGRREFVLGKKGVDLLRFDPQRYREAYAILKESVLSQGNATSPSVIASYFQSLIKSERASQDSEINKQDILDAYILLSDIIDFNINSNETQKSKYLSVQNDIENMFAPYASCEVLVSVFSDRFNENSNDIDFLKKVTLLLNNKSCESSDLFVKVAIRLHELDPTASSSYYMGNMSMKKKSYSQANEYFEQAIQMEDDNKKKSSYYLQIAYAYKMKGSYSTARKNAEKSAQLRSGWGEPYLLIGDIYVAAASNCGNTSFDQSTVYWVAVDAFSKAKNIDNVLSEKANKRIYTYSQYFPSKEECFFNEIDVGSSYTVDCWIGRSTTVRTRD